MEDIGSRGTPTCCLTSPSWWWCHWRILSQQSLAPGDWYLCGLPIPLLMKKMMLNGKCSSRRHLWILVIVDSWKHHSCETLQECPVYSVRYFDIIFLCFRLCVSSFSNFVTGSISISSALSSYCMSLISSWSLYWKLYWFFCISLFNLNWFFFFVLDKLH